jgi:hypothetical protein
MHPVLPGKMPLARAIGTTFAVVLTAVAARAGAVVPGQAVQPPSVSEKSVSERVAAIRAKAAKLSAAPIHDTETSSIDQPAQVAWNDWRNE